MNGKISENGFLMIDRGVRGTPQWKTMSCPFCYVNDGDAYCGDWCAHFGTFETAASVYVSLCHSKMLTIQLENFEDLRP